MKWTIIGASTLLVGVVAASLAGLLTSRITHNEFVAGMVAGLVGTCVAFVMPELMRKEE